MSEKDGKVKTVAAASIMLLLLLPLVPSFAAVTYEPGCKEGQYVKLDVDLTYENISDTPNESERLDIVRIEVTKVEGNNVTLQEKITYEDGHTDKQKFITDVKTQAYVGDVIAGGLSEGDKISENSNTKINGSTTKFYWMNGKMFTLNYYKREQSLDGVTLKQHMYWHKGTGLLMKVYTEMTSGDQTYKLETSLMDTNVGTPWLWLILGIAIAIIVILVVVWKMKKG